MPFYAICYIFSIPAFVYFSQASMALVSHPKSHYCSYLKGERKGKPCSLVSARHTNPDVVSLLQVKLASHL